MVGACCLGRFRLFPPRGDDLLPGNGGFRGRGGDRARAVPGGGTPEPTGVHLCGEARESPWSLTLRNCLGFTSWWCSSGQRQYLLNVPAGRFLRVLADRA